MAGLSISGSLNQIAKGWAKGNSVGRARSLGECFPDTAEVYPQLATDLKAIETKLKQLKNLPFADKRRDKDINWGFFKTELPHYFVNELRDKYEEMIAKPSPLPYDALTVVKAHEKRVCPIAKRNRANLYNCPTKRRGS